MADELLDIPLLLTLVKLVPGLSGLESFACVAKPKFIMDELISNETEYFLNVEVTFHYLHKIKYCNNSGIGLPSSN